MTAIGGVVRIRHFVNDYDRHPRDACNLRMLALIMRIMITGRQLVGGMMGVALLATTACSAPAPSTRSGWEDIRQQMVVKQLRERGINDERVLQAMSKVPRHLFVPESLRSSAYQDSALPIEQGQTISQPYVVALMTEAARFQPSQRVLEVGTGSGYQAAVLAELVQEVYTIELLPVLAEQARTRLSQLGYRNIQVRAGDGYQGWPEAAPFDAVVVTCGAEHVPEPLFEQLKPGGILIIPVGRTLESQVLLAITKGPRGEKQPRDLGHVRFVPLRRGSERRPE